jgi:polysaccharide pyruvyl transferase WcaK-like protein
MRLVLHSRRWVVRFLFELSRCRCLVILGADVIDGRYDLDQALLYLHACRLAAEAGVPARVASFSFSDKPAPQVVNSFARMPQAVRFFVRDPVSLERFRSATGQEATLAADAAFLMAPTAESQTAREAIRVCREWRAHGHTLIGVNLNPLTLPGLEEGVDAYAAEISALMRERPEIRLLLVPHDTRPLHSDAEALSRLLARLDGTGSRAAIVRPPLDAWDARAVVREMDVVVTGRMHLAISALSQAVPTIGVAYMGKFEGLMQHFSLRSSLVSTQEILRAGVLRRMVEEVLARRVEQVATIERALPAVIELARRNVEGLA